MHEDDLPDVSSIREVVHRAHRRIRLQAAADAAMTASILATVAGLAAVLAIQPPGRVSTVTSGDQHRNITSWWQLGRVI